MSYSALDSAPYLDFNDPALEKELSPEEIKKIQDKQEKTNYISTYLPSFPDLNISIIDYIQMKQDILIKDINGKTLLESWFENPRNTLNKFNEQRVITNLLFNPNLIIPTEDLKKIMLDMVYTSFLFNPKLDEKTEEEKKHFIMHFDLLSKFQQKDVQEELITTWFDIFLTNKYLLELIPIAAKYHPDFVERINQKEEDGINLAHRLVYHLTYAIQSDESKEIYYDILHTIADVAPHLFEEKSSKLGTPYEFSIMRAEINAKKEKSEHTGHAIFDAQIGEVWKFFIERKLINKSNTSDKKISNKKKV